MVWGKLINLQMYSTLRAKTDKLEEAVNRELNVTRSWNFIQTVDLAWFIPQMSFKVICPEKSRIINSIFWAESDVGFKVWKLMVFKQRSFEVVEYAN